MHLPEDITSSINDTLRLNKIDVKKIDDNRPWGGFYVISENSLKEFINLYFPELKGTLVANNPLSPKILFVAPHKKLSWQYHHRRSELWRVIHEKVGIVRSDTDEEGTQEVFVDGDSIELQRGERHRLIGLKDWGVVAELWQHSNVNHLSDEDDIVRVQDDFGR